MFALRILPMDSAALTGTVDFSTTILCCPGVTMSAMSRAARSTYFRSGALPFPEKKNKQKALIEKLKHFLECARQEKGKGLIKEMLSKILRISLHELAKKARYR